MTQDNKLPDDLVEEGKKLLEANEYDQAVSRFHEALKINPFHHAALYQLPLALFKSGYVSVALTAYKYARLILPRDPTLLNDIGLCYSALGDSNRALKYFNKALKIHPQCVNYLYNLALTGNQNVKSSQLAELLMSYASSDRRDYGRVLTCFALGHLYEERKEPQRAFTYFAEGNSLRFSLASYNECAVSAFFTAIKKCFNSQFLKNFKTSISAPPMPVFVLGMQRSGTSLVEQILASHSMVCGAGEIDTLSYITDRLIPRSTGLSFPEAIKTLDAAVLAELKEIYMQRLRSHYIDGKIYVVDKTPNNFF